jgi:hypothetical protein
VLTVAELLNAKRIDMPPQGQVNVTFKRAPRVKGDEAAAQRALFDGPVPRYRTAPQR